MYNFIYMASHDDPDNSNNDINGLKESGLATQTTPSVFPLLSCCSSIHGSRQDKVTFACLVTTYFPSPIHITWQPNNNQGTNFPPVLHNSNFYITSSQLTVLASDFQKESYTCVVRHPANTQNVIRKTIDKKGCIGGSRKPLQVRLLTPDCNVHGAESSLELVCFLLSLSHWEARVQWLKNGNVVEKETKVVTLSGDQDSTYFSSSRLSISKGSWDQGDVYTCRVTNPPDSQNVSMYNTSKCEACYSSIRPPAVSITEPSYRDLLEESARIICFAVGSHLENTRVTWQVDGQPSREALQETMQKDASGSQKVRSSHPVLLAQWEKGTRFTCKVAGLCYEEVTREVTIQRAAETTEPSVAISRASLDVSLKSTMGLILVCDVSGFSPKEISISWRKDNLPLSTTLYDAGPVVPAGDTYSTYSLLKIGRDEAGGKGGSYSCVAHHSSSLEPFTATEKVSIDPQAPTVELLQSVNRETDTVMLKCIAYNYRPEKVTIQWTGGPQHKKEVFTEEKRADGTFQASSHFTIPLSQWSDVGNNSCKVVHKETGSTTVRNISREDWIVPTALTLTLSTNPLCPSPHLGDNSTITLLCSIHGYSLEGIQVTWEAAEATQKVLKTETFQKEGGQRFYISSILMVPLGEWNKLQEFLCKVTQSGANNISRNTISKCTACKDSIPSPSLYLLKPPLERLFNQQEALLTCFVVGYGLDHAMLTWLVDDLNRTKDATIGDTKSHRNHTQSLQSQLVISKEIWDSGSKVQCIISHPCSLFPSMRNSIQCIKDSTQAKAPSLSLVVPSPTQVMQPTSQAVAWLTCVVSGFSPAEILVRWKKNNTSVDPSEYITGPSVAGGGHPTFTTQSILKIPASEWESRVLYTCEVGHESLADMKEISKNLYDLLELASPQVMAFHTSEEGERQKLICFATNFYPKNLDIQWSIQGTDLNCSSDPLALVALGDGKFQKSCSLVLSREEWSKPEIYTCTVNHSSTNTLVKKGLHSSGMVLSLNDKTAITMKLPPFEDLFINKSAALTCLMPFENKTTNWTVSWTMDGERADPKAVSTKILKESNHTSWIYGQLWVNLTEWKATVKFTCSIHNGLEETTEYFDRRNGTMKSPKVYLQHQSSKEDLNVTLLCMARDFYPGEIFVKWQEENKEVALKGHDAHDLKCDHEKQICSLISVLEVPKSKWSMGVSYLCLVAHVSSENIITRRANSYSDSWDCAVMGSALCDVRNESEDEYSELEEANNVWNKGSTFMILFLVALFYGGLVTFIKVK